MGFKEFDDAFRSWASEEETFVRFVAYVGFWFLLLAVLYLTLGGLVEFLAG